MSKRKPQAGTRIEGGFIVIRTPIAALPDALKQNPRDDSYHGYSITDANGFAGDVVRELNREAEDGTTPVHLLFDRAMGDAIDDGSAYAIESTGRKKAAK